MPSAPPPLDLPVWPRWLRALLWAVVMVVLLAVFTLYTQADFMLVLADQIWACF